MCIVLNLGDTLTIQAPNLITDKKSKCKADSDCNMAFTCNVPKAMCQRRRCQDQDDCSGGMECKQNHCYELIAVQYL